MLKIKVTSDFLNYINRFTSAEATRYTLQGVFFAPNFDLVATDGHRLGVMATGFEVLEGAEELTEAGGLILSFKDKIAASVLKKTRGELIIQVDDVPRRDHSGSTFATVTDAAGAMLRAEVVDATYPEYKRVVPEPTDTVPDTNKVAFNYKYMADFGSFDKENKTIQIEMHGAESPMLIRVQGLDQFTGVLMPYRWQ